MSIAQTVYDVVELSKKTKVPFLFVSNPGAGKTTGIRKYAEKNGYHLEVVIGSRSTPEELLGYQVNNGGESLEHLDSQWWSRIIENEKKGIPSILFCDEISTCPGQTEGAMLSLIQDRTNQKGEKLPESTIVLGAANYSKNLPSYMDIITPAINRFCVVNLHQDGPDLVSELFHPESNEAKPRTYTAFTDEEEKEFMEMMEKFFSNIFSEYSDKSSSKGFIDINNTNIAGLYQDAEDGLYNVISLRSMSDYLAIFRAALEYGMNDKGFLPTITDGMIGAGSNNFTDEKQGQAFRNSLHQSVALIAKKFMKISGGKKKQQKKFDIGEKTPAALAAAIAQSSQETTTSFVDVDGEGGENAYDDLLKSIKTSYDDYAGVVVGMDENKEKQHAFEADYEAVGNLFDTREKNIPKKIAVEINGFLSRYHAYYNQIARGKLVSDINKTRVFKNYKSSLYTCSLVAVSKPEILEDVKNGVTKVEDAVKSGDMIQVGIRRLAASTPYKIPYNSSISANTLGNCADNFYPVAFVKGKLTAIAAADLAN